MNGCGGSEHQFSRRQILGSMAAGTAAGGFGSLLQHAAADELQQANDKQVLLIWLDGGMSQLESWDPKPGTHYGGPYRSIPTSLPGIHVSELMPQLAQRMDRLAVVRRHRIATCEETIYNLKGLLQIYNN